MSDNQHRFIGALATNVLIGRDKELAAIEHALDPANRVEFQVFAFVAEGGFGKTRLLQQTYTWLGGKPIHGDPLNNPPHDAVARWSNEHTICLPLIDVADPLLHRQVAFLRQIRKNFGDALRVQRPHLRDVDVFTHFDSALARYQEKREQAAGYAEIQEASAALAQSFEKDYRKLTGSYRVVWLVDTVEQLYDIREEIAETLSGVNLKEDEVEQTTYYWLINFIGRQPSNTLFLLSGRPDPSNWINDLKTRPEVKNHVNLFQLKRFDSEEIHQYFSQLHKQLVDEGYFDESDYLKDILTDPQRLQVMYHLTDGNPIRLALYIDMVTSSSEQPIEFNQDIDDIKNLSDKDLSQLREDVDDSVLNYIENGIGHPENTVLRYLLVTRRGLNTKRLKALTGKTLQECEEIFRHLNRLSFVKTRYTKVFLHDELYVIHSRRLARKRELDFAEYQARQRDLEHIYITMIRYCEKQILITNEQINQIQNAYAEGALHTPDDRKRLRDLRQKRPRYHAEKLHYELYLNPKVGFYDRYYTIAEQAFMGRDVDLDSYLQSEINVFFFGAAASANQRQVGLDDDSWKLLCLDVEEERTTRWIKRIIQFGKLNRAQMFAQHIQRNYNRMIVALHGQAVALRQRQHPSSEPQRLFNLESEAYRCFAAILKGDPIGPETLPRTLDELVEIIEDLKDSSRQHVFDPLARTRWRNTIAQCYSNHGYGYASLGSYLVAMESYKYAKDIVRQTEFEALHAEVNNNYARVLGEIGRFHEAEGYCKEGEEVRRKLGFDYAVGLSLSTLALINIRNIRPTPGINPAKKALALFSQLNNPRGIVMATKQLAEAYRRAWLFSPLKQDHFYLTEAERLLRNALPMVTSDDPNVTPVVDENVRYIEIYQEMGSLYRDRLRAEEGGDHPEELLSQAIFYLEKARERATSAKILTHEVDAVLNIAYAYYFAHDYAATDKKLDEALALIPARYILSSDAPFKFEADANLMIFYLLSKLMNLRAMNTALHSPKHLLEYRILGATYSQLFSSDAWYFGQHKADVQTLIDTDAVGTMAERIALANSIIDRYHLRDLQHSGLEQLEVVKIVNDLDAAQGLRDLDF